MKRLLRQIYDDLSNGRLSQGEALAKIRTIKLGDKGRQAGVLLAAPVWQPGSAEGAGQEYTEHHVIVGQPWSSDHVRFEAQLEALLPQARFTPVESDASQTIAQRYTDYALAVFDRIRTILQSASRGKVLVQVVVPGDREQALFTGLSGLLSTAALENPSFVGQLLVVAPEVTSESLCKLLQDEKASWPERVVRYEHGVRQVLRWQEVQEGAEAPAMSFRDDGVYLITGGLGGVGLLFAQEILSCTNARVVLAGRSALDAKKRATLEAMSADRVSYRQADVENLEQVTALVTEITAEHGRLTGILHCAGMIADNFIIKKDAGEFRAVLAPKVAGTFNLDRASRGVELDFFVLFSSFAGALGNVGQADYAAANGFMDQFAAYRNGQADAGLRHGRTRSIDWPLWEAGGMILDPASQERLREATGIAPMQTATGFRGFHRGLALPYAQILVGEGDLARMRLSLFSGRPIEPEVAPLSSVVERGTPENLVEKTEEFLRTECADLLQLPPHQIDPHAALEQYGIDSILAMKLTTRLEQTFGVLRKTLFFEYRTLGEAAQYFIESHAARLNALFASKTDAEPKVEAKSETTLPRIQPKARPAAKRVSAAPRPSESEPIAIIGLSGRYPEAFDVEAYWANLRDGKDCITEVPKERWDWREYFSEDRTETGRHFSKWGGFIAGVDEFDPLFFSISPKEAKLIDPQERLFLQHAWMAIEDAGYTRASLQVPEADDLPGQVGVYVGVMYTEYQLHGSQRTGIAGSPASIANRVSYALNLHGPSVTLDTMCSSSLTAIHFACLDLKLGRTSLAIAGGVNVSIHPNKYLVLSAGQFISSDGHCQSFGEGGDGYIPGEGVGAVILKRLSDAVRDGDHIHGVIRGSALNHGGRTNGYTVPNPQAQAGVISRALAEAKTNPRHISYLEAHGTGTKLGDPIEIAALTRAFGRQTRDTGFCLLGSAKSNIGHCESAAGIAALTKVLLQMQHRQIVPSLHSAQLNPHIDFATTPFVVNQTLTPWEQPVVDGQMLPRIAGISSFGAGGSNAHLIIEEYQAPAQQRAASGPVAIVLSARTTEQLQQKVRDLLNFVRVGTVDLQSMAYTLQVGREALDQRAAFVADSAAQLIEKLEAYVAGRYAVEGVETLSPEFASTLQQWIAGGKQLDWAALYGETKPSRVSLPTYPFARDRYWIEIAAAAPVATTAAVLHPLLHTNTSDLTQQSYTSTFTGNEPFLQERDLPAAAYLEMARAAVRDATRNSQESAIELREVIWAQPVVVDGKTEVSIALLAHASGEVDFEIYSGSGDAEIVHCQGRALFGTQPAADRVQGTEMRLSASDPNAYVLPPSLLDAALQACGTPFAIESLRILAPCTAEMVARISNGAIDLYDTRGTLCVQLRGISTSAPWSGGLQPAEAVAAPQRREITLIPTLARRKPAAIALTVPGEPLAAMPPATRAPITLSNASITVSPVRPFDDGHGIFSIEVGTGATTAHLLQALHALRQEASLKVLILTGIERAVDRNAELYDGLVSFPYPVIATLRENAIGEGFLTAALCDFMVCSEEASYGITDATPSIAALFAERFGDARAQDFLYLSRIATGAQLRAKGWTCPIVPASRVETEARELASTLAAKSQDALRLLKQHRTRRFSGLTIEGVTPAVTAEEVLIVRSGESISGGNYKAVVVVSEDGTFPELDTELPVVAALAGDVRGNAWRNAQLCDAVVYSRDAVYSAAGVDVDAAALFTRRFGAAATEILLTGGDYSGAELERRTGVITAQRDRVVATAVEVAMAAARARLPRAQRTASVVCDATDEATITAATPIALQSRVVTATIQPGGIAVVKMEDRDAKNMFSEALIDGIHEVFARLEQMPACKVVVLTGYDHYFASGGTKETLLAIQSGQTKFTDATIFRVPFDCKLPVLSAMQGHGIGAGWAMGMFADVALLSEESRYVSPYMNYGFTPGAGATHILPATIGNDLGGESLLTGRTYTGRELKERGLRLPILPRTGVQPAAMALAEQIARSPRARLVALKQQFAAAMAEPLAETCRLEVAMHEQTFVGHTETLAQIHSNFHVEAETAAPAPQAPATTTSAPAAEAGEVNDTLKTLLANELQMRVSEIDDDAQFVDLGLDSVAGVTWIRRINEKYQTSIEATKIYSYPTVAQLSQHVREEAEKLGTMAKPAAAAPAAAAPMLPIKKAVQNVAAQTTLTSRRSRNASRLVAPTTAPARGSQAIAIIGMAGQFPEAGNPEEFWRNLAAGKNSITEVPRERWDVDAYFQAGEIAPGKTNSQWVGALAEYDRFDPLFFNISPAEAESMDPQQRLFLQACWQSIEHAGYDPRSLSGTRCGVFAGCAFGDYHLLSRQQQLSGQSFTGDAMSILAARISYFLNLQGPCVSIDTACSSSLVALASACDSLVSGASDLALTGGVYVMSGPEIHVRTSQAGMLSPRGQCFTFDERADGIVLGEGVGVVMLKRLADAERDGDVVYGVIEGWGVNQDGKTNGITAPNPESQTRLEQYVYDKFEIDPASIQLIEAHGTGTKLGDPIEVEGLKKAFKKYTEKKSYCALGSVKSNIGHNMTAAGISGVIKILLALKHRQLPPSVNFERLNEHIDLNDSPFYVNNRLQEWKLEGATRRRAAISSFGFSGTNAHVVIGEHQPPVEVRRPVAFVPQDANVIVPLSARTAEQLRQKAIDLLGFLRNETVDLYELAWTLQAGRTAMDERLGFVVSSVEQLQEKLAAWIDGEKELRDVHQGQGKRGNESLSILTQNEDIRKTVVDNWIAARKLGKLLELWVKGLDLDWSRFYGEAKPKRAGLPTYPFAKDRYWIEASAAKALTGATTAVLHPLLHSNTSDLTQQSYSATFSGDEFFLTDHQVRAAKVLPGMAYLEMARAAIANALPIAPEATLLELRGTAWIQPVIVRETAKVHIALMADDAEQIDYEIYSDDETVHCQGRAVFSRQPAPAALDLVQLASSMTSMDVSGIYPAFARMGLQYGPAFQGITALRRGNGQVLAELRLPKTADASADYVLHPSLLDSALQSCIGLVDEESTEPRVPFALDTLRVIAPCTNEMFAWVRYAADGRKLDLDLTDAQGNICAQLHGLALRTMVERRASARLVATQAWQPAALDNTTPAYTTEQILNLLDATDYTEAAVTCFEKLQAILQSKPEGNVLLQVVVSDERFAALSAMLQTASLENPRLTGQVIVVDAAEELSSILRNERGAEPLVRYENGRRSVMRWQEVQSSEAPVAFKDRGVYLITGGAGAIGALFAREILARTENARVIVTGRAPKSRAPIAGVSYRQVDLADADQVRQLVATVRYEYGQLDGILHCAGMTADNFIIKKSVAEVRDVLAPKVAGTLHLDAATREVELDFFVLFSSYAVRGNAGQADYAAANAFMDRFAAARNRQVEAGDRYGRTRSINWPFWQEGGIALDETTRELLQKTTGIQPLQTATGLDAFHRALALPHDQLLVVEGDLAQMRRTILAAPTSGAAGFTPPSLDGRAEARPSTSAENLFGKTEEYLRRQLSAILKMTPQDVDPTAALETYGIDSILAMKLTTQLEQTFGSLSKTLFFEYQSIRELTGYFVKSHAAKLATLFAAAPVTTNAQTTAQPVVIDDAKPATSRRSRRLRIAGSHAAPEADPIAIIGLSGRYPEAVDVEAYWENLRDGKDCIVEVPESRWDWKAYFSDDRTQSGHHFSKWGGFISGVDEFDPLFFNIAPKDARQMDPQERLFLQHAYMAIEDAGYTRAGLQAPSHGDLPGQVGVYAGVMYSEYQLFGADASARGNRVGIAGSAASIANRVSYAFNLHGPSVTLDTMCSSSLTAIHLACQDLKLGRTSMAIAGGVNVTIHPNKYLVLSAGQFISSDGHCQSFGEGGDGYIPGEGVGVVVLKRLSEAKRDGDHVYGIIRGSALNHGGKTNGYTVPNPQAQATAISRALAESKTDARHVSYIEAHGTGTKLGDPIEIAALSKAFDTTDTGFCLIGSAKSNIGHCESAAGVAGLTKVLLQMQHRQIVPSLHSAQLNPHIDFGTTPFIVNQTLTPWEQPVVDGRTLPRIAGISSFGAGGSNAHLIIEEYAQPMPQPQAIGPVVILLSARTAPQLRQKAQDLLRFVRRGNVDLLSIAYTLQTGRESMDERLGLIVNSVDELTAKLAAYVAGEQGIEDAYQGQAKRNNEALSVFGTDSDLQQTIEKWISGGKLARLVDLWVKGLELDWTKLYGEVKPQRTSLPTYPFAKERYWVDITPAAPVVAPKSVTTAVLHPLLHSNTSDLAQQSYSTTFHGHEAFLKNGQLPAAAYLEMARVAVQKAARISEPELRDVVWAQPVVVDGSKEISIALFAGEGDQVEFEIYSDDTVHCQGRAISNAQSATTPIEGESIRLGTIETLDEAVLDPGVVDAALAACGATSSIESLRVFAPCTREMVAKLRRANGTADVDLCDARGNVCVQLRGVSIGVSVAVEEIEPVIVASAPRPAPVRREILLAPLAPSAPMATAERRKPAPITLAAPAAATLPQPPASRARIALSSTIATASSVSSVRLYDEGNGVFSIHTGLSSAELRQVLDKVQQEPSLRVLLLHGLAATDAVVPSLIAFPYPVIAVLPSDTTGAGFLSAALCDFMICSDEARYGLTAVVPSAMPFLRERFGNAYRATVATARAQAWSCPIVPVPQVETAANELAATLAEKSQEALRLLKQHLTRNLVALADGLTAATVEPRSGVARVIDAHDLGRTNDATAVVLRIEDEQLSDEAARDLQRRIVESPVPVIAAVSGDATGNAWLVAQFCDAAVYNNTGLYSSAGAQISTAAAAFTHRLGNEAAREILLTAAPYAGAALRRRAGVVAADDVVTTAIAVAESWGNRPRNTFASWSEERVQSEEASAAPVALRSSVVTVTPQANGVVVVKMEDREAKNMFSDALREGVAEAFAHIAATPSYKVVVLTGYDTYFASGGTKESLLAIQAGTIKFTDSDMFQLPLACRLPVVAAMQGHGIGAGWSLGMFADIAVLSEESRYVSPYMQYGFTPGAGATWSLNDKMGQDLSRESLLTAQPATGRALKERGLRLSVLPRAEVLETALGVAKQMATQSRERLLALKQQLTAYAHEPLAETLRRELAMHETTFVGQSDTLSRILDNFHQESSEPAPAVTPQPAVMVVEQASDADALSSVSATLKMLLANELQMSENDVDDQTQFVDMGLDSISGVTWIRKINEKYQTTIEATKVYSFPTLAQLSRHVEAEAAKLGTLPKVAVETPVAATPVVVEVPKPKKVVTVERSSKQLTSRRGNNARFATATSSTPAPAPAPRATQAIAIIGMAGEFPQAKNLEQYWQNLAEGKNCVTQVARERWDVDAYYQAGDAAPGKTNSQWLGAIDGYDRFDPAFFNISPTEAVYMDPQQRVFLQAAWHSIEHAGYDARVLAGSNCGVFVGCATGDYHQLSRAHQLTAHGFTGSASSVLAARISYFLDLQGPCVSIDTACSSSLVAIAQACDSLVSGVTSMALAGGVYVMAGPEMHIRTAQAAMLSPDGKCYTFDQRANGFVPGEAVGVVVLKRLEDAERDGDTIYGVIQGWGVNQDGKTNGITAPNPESQTRLEQEVYDKYGIDPANIQLVEAHGTGTKLGDPIEVEGLKASFRKYTQQTGSCAIGSVKSNIGHTLTAAGIAGVIKLVLALQHKQLPPTIHFERLNEHIDLNGTPFYVNTRLQEWERRGTAARQSAISSFGFSGTNAHLVIGEYEAPAAAPRPQQTKVLIPLSARTGEQLRQKAADLLGFLRRESATDLTDLAYTLQTGRSAMDERLAFVVSSAAQLVDKLQAWLGETKTDDVWQGQAKRNREALALFADSDLQQAIDKWYGSRKLARLADLWVKGLELDWKKLYSDVRPRRIGVPAYPFAQERYWIDVANEPQHAVAATAVIHPLLHGNASDLSGQRYRSTFTGAEAFLEGRKVLPAAAYLEMARAAVEHALPVRPAGTVLELRDTVWAQPVVIEGKTEVTVALQGNESDGIDFEISSNDVIHCQGRALFVAQPATVTLDVARLTRVANAGDFVIHPNVLEGTPAALQTLRIVGTCSGDLYASNRGAELDLCDERGNVCIEIRGLAAAALTTTGSVFATPVWEAGNIEGVKREYAERHVILRQLDKADYAETALACFERVQNILREKRQGKVLVQIAVADPLFVGLAGLLRTAAQENPQFFGQLVLVPSRTTSAELEALLDAEASRGDVVVRYEGGNRQVLRWQEVADAEAPVAFREEGVYLITGGTGGLGLLFTEEILTKTRTARVILTGRASESRVQLGARVSYRQFDLSDAAQVESVIDSIGRIDGILHCAGALIENPIVQKSAAEFADVLAPKVAGTLNLDHATRNLPLDFFVLFSSIAGAMGNPRTADYAVANAFLDRFAAERNQQVSAGLRHGRTRSINWPVWQSGTMGTDAASQERLEQATGMLPMQTATGMHAFHRGLSLLCDQLLVVEGNPEKIRAHYLQKATVTKRSAARPQVTADELQQRLKAMLATVLGLQASSIDLDHAFSEMGLDSFLGTELVIAINKEYGTELAHITVFDYPNVRELARFLELELKKQTPAVAESIVEQTVPAAAAPRISLKKKTGAGRSNAARRRAQHDDRIAIIGMSGRYPEAANLQQYWENLAAGKNSIGEVPRSRWDANRWYDPTPATKDKAISKWLGAVADVDCFDPLFFRISPQEAEYIDPHHRLFLEESYKAFEDAGYSGQTLGNKKCGVYLGVAASEYPLLLAKHRSLGDTPITSNHTAIAAARIAYYLNLKGPAISVDTACSSSLVAIHLACQGLLTGETDMALAGGVAVWLTPESYLSMTQAGMLSASGQCKAFDDSADGIVVGDGVGALVLKRLADAEADGDFIYGVILGSGINQDGRTNGITAPSVNSQIELERGIYDRFDIDPDSISYVEAHGTGTPLGDPIELEALSTVFKERTSRRNFCAVGSVKSNIGHTTSAAGVAGVQKVLLSMRNRTLVPTLHVTKENARFDFSNSPFYVSRETKTWETAPGTPRRAAVSSFGFSGTNAHLVIEEYPMAARTARHDAQLVPLSARTPEQLRQKAADLLERIAQEPLDLPSVAYTLQTGREAMDVRAAFVAGSVDELAGQLAAFAAGDTIGAHGNGELQQLADAWVRGTSVDWNQLHGDATPQRISLPAYPFARERYWIDDVTIPDALDAEFETSMKSIEDVINQIGDDAIDTEQAVSALKLLV